MCVRPDFTMSANVRRLVLERAGEELERRQQLVDSGVERREVHRRREHVVRRLPHVDVVVRVDVVAGEGRDHLVRVHVRARAGAGLEDVDRELVVELARCDPVACLGDALGDVAVEEPEVGVRARRGGLDPAEPVRDGRRDRLARNGEVRNGFRGLSSPQLPSLGGAAHPSECIGGRVGPGGVRHRFLSREDRANFVPIAPHAHRESVSWAPGRGRPRRGARPTRRA